MRQEENQRKFNQFFLTVKLFNNSSIKFAESIAMTFGKGNRIFCQKPNKKRLHFEGADSSGKEPCVCRELKSLCPGWALVSTATAMAKNKATTVKH